MLHDELLTLEEAANTVRMETEEVVSIMAVTIKNNMVFWLAG